MLGRRDKIILQKILHYCDNIETAIKKYDIGEDVLPNDEFLSAMCGMFVQQIGELAKHLTDDFVLEYSEQPWKQIRGMRNIYAHEYESINPETVWKTISVDIPELKSYCEKILEA